MPQFYYQALNANHERVAGHLTAASLAQALAQLESQGLSVQSISSRPISDGAAGENPFADRDAAGRTTAEQAALQQHLQQALARGRDVLPALKAYSQELPTGRRRRELDTVLRTIERGDANEAARTLATLPGYWIPLLGAAAASRDPGRVLREFVQESDRAIQLQGQWWLALAYPALLGGLAAFVFAALSIFVIPLFRSMFADFGLNLPPLTLLVLGIAEWISSGRILIVAAVVVAAVLLLREATRQLPISVRNWFGDHLGFRWGRSTALARFSQLTADVLEAALDRRQAIGLAGSVTGRAPISRFGGRSTAP